MRKWKVIVEVETDIRADTPEEAEEIAQRLMTKVLVPGPIEAWDVDVSVTEYDDRADHAHDLAGDR